MKDDDKEEPVHGLHFGDDKQVAKPDLQEHWTRGNKDQLLFERLIEKWIK